MISSAELIQYNKVHCTYSNNLALERIILRNYLRIMCVVYEEYYMYGCTFVSYFKIYLLQHDHSEGYMHTT